MRRRFYNHRKPGLVPGFFLLLAITGCDGPAGNGPTADGVPARLALAGHIDKPALNELSGMARSGRDPDLLWVHNDSGDKARLYAIGVDGQYRGRLEIADAGNIDWEDVASFSRDGHPYLLAADIGDNDGRRASVSLYVVEEPAISQGAKITASPAWRIDFRYPDGPRDAEAVAVDASADAVFVLSKRDLPLRLYRIPLSPAGGAALTATRLDTIVRLPQPARRDIDAASLSKDWYWQPTAMDIAADGTFVAVLTYGAVYYFRWMPGTGVDAALGSPPLQFPLKGMHDAEALAIDGSGRRLFITVEKKAAPLYRIDLEPDSIDQDSPEPQE